MTLHDETVLVDGRAVRLWRGGAGVRRVLFLHGWGSSSLRFHPAVDALPDAFGELVLPDLPGFGETPPPPVPWGIEEYEQWALHVLDVLGWDSAVVAGHSFGGGIALSLAAHHPARVRGLLLYAVRGLTARRTGTVRVFTALAKTGKAMLGPTGGAADLARKILYRLAGTRDYLRAGDLRATLVKVLAADLRPLVPSIRVPTAVLWGTADRDTPVAAVELLRNVLPGVIIRTIPGGGHALHREQPQVFASAIHELMTKIAP